MLVDSSRTAPLAMRSEESAHRYDEATTESGRDRLAVDSGPGPSHGTLLRSPDPHTIAAPSNERPRRRTSGAEVICDHSSPGWGRSRAEYRPIDCAQRLTHPVRLLGVGERGERLHE